MWSAWIVCTDTHHLSVCLLEVVFFEGVELWIIGDWEQESSQGTQHGEYIPDRGEEEDDHLWGGGVGH